MKSSEALDNAYSPSLEDNSPDTGIDTSIEQGSPRNVEELKDVFFALESERSIISDLESMDDANLQVLIDEYGAEEFVDAIFSSDNLYDLISKLESHREIQYILYEKLKGSFVDTSDNDYDTELQDDLNESPDDSDQDYSPEVGRDVIGSVRHMDISKDDLAEEMSRHNDNLRSVIDTRKEKYNIAAQEALKESDDIIGRLQGNVDQQEQVRLEEVDAQERAGLEYVSTLRNEGEISEASLEALSGIESLLRLGFESQRRLSQESKQRQDEIDDVSRMLQNYKDFSGFRVEY